MTTVELLARLEAESTFGDEINAWISGTRKALEAIQRVRELADKFDSSSHYTGHFITDAIFKALDGEQR